MASATIYVTSSSPQPGGYKQVSGKINMSANYYTGGDQVDFSNHFNSGSYPHVICNPASGYVFEHDEGTTSAGKILAYFTVLNTSNVANANRALTQVTANTSLSSINVKFFATGPAY